MFSEGKNRAVQVGVMAAVAIAGVYGILYWDVTSRAKEAFRQGETYMWWNAHPGEKKDFFEKKFQKDKAALDKFSAKKKLPEDEYKEKLSALEFDRDYRINESSLKYAYQWYKDTYELFSPPESTWVKQARAKAPHALEMWKNELREQKIPFEDTMFE